MSRISRALAARVLAVAVVAAASGCAGVRASGPLLLDPPIVSDAEPVPEPGPKTREPAFVRAVDGDAARTMRELPAEFRLPQPRPMPDPVDPEIRIQNDPRTRR